MNRKGRAIYPYSEWEIREDALQPEYQTRNESIFSLGNGYIGFRGNFEEAYGDPQNSIEGTYLNGFYESGTIQYGEIAYGYPEKSQTMLNVTNAKRIGLSVDGEAFDMARGEISEYSRTLLLREGVLRRNVVWQSEGGKRIRLSIDRIVSFKRKHIAALRYEVTPLNFSGEIALVSELDGNVSNQICDKDPRVGAELTEKPLRVIDAHADEHAGCIVQKANGSGLSLACSMEHQLESQNPFACLPSQEPLSVKIEYRGYAAQEQPIVLYKYIAYTDSNDYCEEDLAEHAKAEARRACHDGYEGIRQEQKAYLDDFWYNADIEIDGDPAMQQGIRFNLFHLLQSTGGDGKRAVCAKGLTGEGYGGHYFWDTEMYVLPFFLNCMPKKAKGLLEYRYNTLEQARERARQLSHAKGALYPWRTINGEECSANYPSGTAQYHIDADIAYAVKRYMDATQDEDFMLRFGTEMVFETARLWADLGDYIPAKGDRFCINGVTGPDEYSAVVNNNCYTNLMARFNMEYACVVEEWMQRKHPESYRVLADRIGLAMDEPAEWKRAAENMFIPYDEQLGVHLQDDAFLDRAPWDFAHTPEDKYPLLLHFHPLVIYRHRVCKQADMVLALLLLWNQFSLEQKERDYRFYDECTTHDSSLSASIFSIIASEIGYDEQAYQYFADTARTDMDDLHGNTKDGIHIAGMAGTWMGIVQGFAGMRCWGDELVFRPDLPAAWQGYRFKLAYRGCLLGVAVDCKLVRYKLLSGDAVRFRHGDETIILNGEQNEVGKPLAIHVRQQAKGTNH